MGKLFSENSLQIRKLFPKKNSKKFGDIMKAYRTQKIMHQKGPLLLYDLPFRSNALIEIIVLNNEDKNYNKCYPVAKLFEIGRLKFKCSIEEWMSNSLKYSGLHPLELTPQISIESCNLPCNYHKDSADQIIVAIARTILYLDPCIKDISILRDEAQGFSGLYRIKLQLIIQYDEPFESVAINDWKVLQ